MSAYRALPPDSLNARTDLIAQDVPGFRIAFDSLLVTVGPEDAGWGPLLERAAADFLQATGDSLLLSDLAFIGAADPPHRARWIKGVHSEEAAWSLQAGGKAGEAAESFRQAARVYGEVGHLRREAVAWGSVGVACWSAGDFECVGDAYHRALPARRRLGDALLVGRTLNGLGTLHFRLSRYDSALVYYEEARKVRTTLNRPADLGTTLAYMGNVYFFMGDLEAALARYQEAVEVLGPNGPRGAVSDARIGLANVLSSFGEHPEAIRIYREELDAVDSLGLADRGAHIRTNLAQVYLALGDHRWSLRLLRQAERVLTDANETYELANTQLWLGNVYWSLSDYPRALGEYSKSQQTAEQTGNETVRGTALVNLGRTYHRMGLTEKAISTLEHALHDFTEHGNRRLALDAMKELAVVEKEGAKDLERALALHDSVSVLAGELGLPSEAAINRGNRANVLSTLGRFPEAVAEYRRGIGEAESLGRRDIAWPCLLGLADVHEREGRLDSASVYNRQAITVMEGLRGVSLSEESKAAYLGQWSYVYETQIHVLVRLYEQRGEAGYLHEAFDIAERGKARALLDVLSEGQVDLTASLPEGLRAEWASVERSLNSIRYRMRTNENAPADSLRSWKSKLRELESREDALLEEGRLKQPQHATLDGGKPLSVAELQESLLGRPGSLLLEYSLGDSVSYLFTVTREGLEVNRLPPRGEIEVEVRRLRAALSNPLPAGDVQLLDSATTLYRGCLAPAAAVLEQAQDVLIVPDGTLQFVPFEVLIPGSDPLPADPEARARALSRLPYALREIWVTYGPSATVLSVLGRKPEVPDRGRGILAVGDPVFRPEGSNAPPPSDGLSPEASALAALPQTRAEVETIAKVFPPQDRTILLGQAARESTLAAAGFLADRQILHFATHGLVDERRPERSSLALSYPQGPSEDEYLQASEIYRLRLNADLVVLSACETGVGRMVRGEGVLGLPRAFLHAGARAVVVSLWSVSDRSTAQFMAEFYRALISGGEAPSRALARAKQELRRRPEFSHPFYWAPFVLIGSPISGLS